MWLGAGAPNLHICVAWGSIHTWGFVCPALNRFVYHTNFPIPYGGVELTSNLWQKWIQTVWEAQVRFGSIVYSDDVWKYSVRISVWKHCISCKHKCGLPVTVQNPKSWGWSCLFGTVVWCQFIFQSFENTFYLINILYRQCDWSSWEEKWNKRCWNSYS